MSTQYYDTYPKYCTSCQELKEYENQEIIVTRCPAADEFIEAELYNQMVARLKRLQEFGESDSTVRKPIDAQQLTNKSIYTEIETDFYNSIAEKVLSTYTQQLKDNIIYGSYFDELKTAVNNYKIPDTRYYTCSSQGVTSCCDCYGQCWCYGECSCYGQCSCYGECGSYGDCGQTAYADG